MRSASTRFQRPRQAKRASAAKGQSGPRGHAGSLEAAGRGTVAPRARPGGRLVRSWPRGPVCVVAWWAAATPLHLLKARARRPLPASPRPPASRGVEEVTPRQSLHRRSLLPTSTRLAAGHTPQHYLGGGLRQSSRPLPVTPVFDSLTAE